MNIDNNKIKNSFPKSTSKFHSKIQLTLDELPEKKEIYIMNRKKTFKRGLAICAAAVLLIGTTAFAAGKLVPRYIQVHHLYLIITLFQLNKNWIKSWDTALILLKTLTMDLNLQAEI